MTQPNTTAPHSPTSEEKEEYATAYSIATEREASVPVEEMAAGQPVVWRPQAGSQTAFMQCPLFEALYHGTRGPGKALPLEQQVLTPEGQRRMGELRPGDLVLAPDGTPTAVTGYFPQGVRRTYRLIWDDGTEALCDDEHLWPVAPRLGVTQPGGDRRQRNPYKIVTARQLRANQRRGRLVEMPTAAFFSGEDYRPWRQLVSGEFAGKMECACISVEHPSGLFLLPGDVVTHNTDALIMSYAQHAERGHGAAWRGIIFRQTYPQLADVQAKTEKWFRQIFGGRCNFNQQRMEWRWASGEMLLLRHLSKTSDYYSYHGAESPFLGFEELSNWATDEVYRMMFSICRTSAMGVPRMIRGTTNPYGPGHNWIKDRFRLHGKWWETQIITGEEEPPRVAIHGHIDENLILLRADPHYKSTILASATNPAMAEAWLDGSWEIVAGGMFDDVWNPRVNVLEPFEVPSSWLITRAFDWGSSRPFSVGWWAESDGTDLKLPDGKVMSTVRGDLFRVREWYGTTGQANQGLRMLAQDVAQGIVERELLWGWRTGSGKGEQNRVKPGPADNSINDVENGVSIAVDMQKPVRLDGKVHRGISWTWSDKRPGSRKSGWELMRLMMRNAKPREGLPREQPGLFVIGRDCPQFLRTVPNLPRSEKDPDDVDTDAEDHIADETRYRVRSGGQRVRQGQHSGMW